jgi:hypothetical protein
MDQDIISELRRPGYRITTARRAVLSSRRGSAGHLTADHSTPSARDGEKRQPNFGSRLLRKASTASLWSAVSKVTHSNASDMS